MDELNKIVMLRDISSLTVEHSNGIQETIAIPEDIGLELFQNNAFPAFGMRSTSSYVEVVDQASNTEKAGLQAKRPTASN